MITTNLDFARWIEVFGDAQMTTALLDRLIHRAVILVTNGESYRFRESMRVKESEAAG
ncbi:ATPase AAA [Limnochorda pilosa]|uniref:ATPase AAA n=1 Tax=Limnochorda pilosa TaxID=1555112 RepID=A0A0K2SM35_LIMPI|nr:ATPase AAA [Limnochorda pilosa]